MRHVSFFSGIDGFGLAAAMVGWENVAHVDINDYCRLVSKKVFPDSVGFKNIIGFNYQILKSALRKYGKSRGPIDVVSGGFPCQPFSHAGLREGVVDYRFLWPQMFEAVRSLSPRIVVVENVLGLVTMERGAVLERVCTDLESEGYQVEPPLVLPSLSVGAPHQRYRVFVVAYRQGERFGETRKYKQRQKKRPAGIDKQHPSDADHEFKYGGRETWGWWTEPANNDLIDTPDADPGGCGQAYGDHDVLCRESDTDNGYRIPSPDADCDGLEVGEGIRRYHEQEQPAVIGTPWGRHWLETAAELCRVDDGVPEGLDETGLVPATAPKKNKKAAGRSHRIEGLGNAIVPHLVYEIFKVINDTLK